MFKRVCLWVLKFGQWKRKWTADSILVPQLHRRSTESWKLYLNLCSLKWLKPILRRVRSFSLNRLFMLKRSSEFGPMKFNECFLKISRVKVKLVQLTYYLWRKIIFEEIMFNFKRCYVIWVSGSVNFATTCY